MWCLPAVGVCGPRVHTWMWPAVAVDVPAHMGGSWPFPEQMGEEDIVSVELK